MIKPKTIFLWIGICHFMIGGLLSAYHEESNQQLEQFWRILFKEYHFGYTLFGEKPIALDCKFVSIYERPLFSSHPQSLSKESWLLWEEASSKLSSRNYVMKHMQYTNLDEQLMEEFYLVNKKKSLFIITRYWEEFKRYFPQADNPEQVLKTICENGPHVVKNKRLLGLLLGYGDHNTTLFQKKHNLSDLLASMICMQDHETLTNLTYDEFIEFIYTNKHPVIIPKDSWASLLDEYRKIDSQLSSSFNSLIPYKHLLSLPLVPCRVDPTDLETKEILSDSLNTQIKLLNIYHDPKFLEIILHRFEE